MTEDEHILMLEIMKSRDEVKRKVRPNDWMGKLAVERANNVFVIQSYYLQNLYGRETYLAGLLIDGIREMRDENEDTDFTTEDEYKDVA